jgi:hypothetical protein
MLYYLTAERQAATMAFFLASWGKALHDRVRIYSYEALGRGVEFPIRDGVYVFAALDGGLGSRQPPSRLREMASALHARLVQMVGPHKVLNHPLHSLGRYALLKALHQRGINSFDACRLGERPGPHRFPVYVRKEISSGSVEPPLLGSGEYGELSAAAAADQTQVAIEFCNTADGNGVYRKYGAVVLGSEVVPRHLFRSRSWFVKQADLGGAEWMAEELAYLESDGHAAVMREVCRIANIGYGRIDYALLDGRPQIWEINHTPELVFADPNYAADPRAPVHRRFTELFVAALNRLEGIS